ncbi:hypothetical protein [Archangium sp.]|uniref:hypothetical protein n=1 Tax=Archangium sp. TaxID=1872627 RepID=UPI002D5FB86B|nr:hypothetical protein [Archangium sp.]HYO54042.1 hypothetical protein [Archangium sp.]
MVGTIPGIMEVNGAACPSDERPEDADNCYAYDSEWKLVPNPEHTLPDLVVTTRGTRMREGKREEIESFHDIRTFSFRSGEYTLSSRKDVPR